MDTGAHLRMLVAEDDPGCRTLTARIIREMGHTPLEADGEAAALRLIHTDDISLVLADLSMEKPDSGLRVATEVRRLQPGTPVILMTGRPGTDTAIPGLRAGACDYLIKPFRPRELIESIRRALAEHSHLDMGERRRDAMIAIVNHELRTPLCAAEMAAELLADETPGPETLDMRKLLSSNLTRLHETIEEFLLHADLASGRAAAAPRPADLLALVRREADAVRPLAEKRRILISLTTIGPDRLVPLDAELAGQALRHLLINAVHFNRDAGDIRVAVDFQENEARVSVSDDGAGMPADEIDRIFDPFYQTEDYHTRRVGGIGLGLAIVRLTMEAHGGSAKALSSPGGGSTFTLLFPVESPRTRTPNGLYVA